MSVPEVWINRTIQVFWQAVNLTVFSMYYFSADLSKENYRCHRPQYTTSTSITEQGRWEEV